MKIFAEHESFSTFFSFLFSYFPFYLFSLSFHSLYFICFRLAPVFFSSISLFSLAKKKKSKTKSKTKKISEQKHIRYNQKNKRKRYQNKTVKANICVPNFCFLGEHAENTEKILKFLASLYCDMGSQ